MSDVSKVKINNVTYNMKDPAIRDSPAFTGTPTAPTAGVGTNSTQIATTAFIVSHDDFHVTGNASVGSSVTFTDARIVNDHWEVDGVIFGTPSNVTSGITWATNATNHTVTLTCTFAGATTVDIKMHYVQ